MVIISHPRLVQIWEPSCWTGSATRLLAPCQLATWMTYSKEGELAGNEVDFETSWFLLAWKRLPSSFVKCLTSFSFREKKKKKNFSSSLLQRIFLKTIIGTTPMCFENFLSCTRKHDVSCFLNQIALECPMPSFGISNPWDKAKKRERVRNENITHPNCEGNYSLCMWWRAGIPSGKCRATVREGITFRKEWMQWVSDLLECMGSKE